MPVMDTKTAPPKLLHIFKPGRHITAAGEEIEFSVADVVAMATAYDPKLGKAPIVVGHPKTDDPSYGWAKKLYIRPRGLYAEPDKVDPQFAEEVNAGRYGTISSKFYRPTDPNNPKPGVWYLRHIGFLGATPPAVKGLDEPEFAEDDGCVTFNEPVEFSGWADTQVAGVLRRLREWFIETFGSDTADKVIPDYAVAGLEDEARQELAEDLAPAPAFSDPDQLQEKSVKPEEAAELLRQNADLQNQIKNLQEKNKQDEKEKRHADHVAFAEGLVGKVKPEQRDVIVATLDALSGMETPVEFGEGDAKQPLANAFKGLFADLPNLVEFGEFATKDRSVGSPVGDVEFADKSVDQGRLELHAKATALAAKDGIPYEEAVRRFIK